MQQADKLPSGHHLDAPSTPDFKAPGSDCPRHVGRIQGHLRTSYGRTLLAINTAYSQSLECHLVCTFLRGNIPVLDVAPLVLAILVATGPPLVWFGSPFPSYANPIRFTADLAASYGNVEGDYWGYLKAPRAPPLGGRQANFVPGSRASPSARPFS